MPAASNRSLISVSEIIFRAFPAAKGVTKTKYLFGWLVGEIQHRREIAPANIKNM